MRFGRTRSTLACVIAKRVSSLTKQSVSDTVSGQTQFAHNFVVQRAERPAVCNAALGTHKQHCTLLRTVFFHIRATICVQARACA